MGAQVIGSTWVCDTPSDEGYNSQAWTKDSVNVWGIEDGHQPGSSSLSSDLVTFVDEYLQFPNTPSFEEPVYAYLSDTTPRNHYPLNTDNSQHGSALLPQQVDFIPDQGLFLENQEATGMAKESKDSVVGSKKRGRKPKGPFTPAQQRVRREKFLDRNRSAASRCRHRKKQEVEQLKERYIELQRTNTKLVVESFELKSELENLANMVMSCDSCCQRRALAIERVRESRSAPDEKSKSLWHGAVLSEAGEGVGDNTNGVSEERILLGA